MYIIDEPGTYYTIHLTPENGTGRAIAKAHKFLVNNELVIELKVFGIDDLVFMIEKFSGFIWLLKNS